jgi:hypothetical protein
MRSSAFLRAIQFSEFVDMVTTLQSHVNSYHDDYEDGYLPPHLGLHGLASSIHQNAQAHLRDIPTPRAGRLHGGASRVQGLSFMNQFSQDYRQRNRFCERSGDHPDGNYHVGRDNNAPRSGRSLQHDETSTHGRGSGWLAHPDCNRQPFLPDVQCAACKQVGHVAKNCNMLVMAICLQRYMKHDMSASICNSIEKERLNPWKERLENPTTTPRKVLRAYMEDLDITVANLDGEMDWECWEDDNDTSQSE